MIFFKKPLNYYMKNNYYLIQNDIQTGPYRFIDLPKIIYKSNNLIWVNGLPDWVVILNFNDICNKIETAKNDLTYLNNQIQKNNSYPAFSNESKINIFNVDSLTNYEIATSKRRFAAFLLNFIICLFSFSAIYNIIPNFYAVLTFPILSALPYYFWSGNIGHKILNLKVVDKTSKMEFKNPFYAFLREFIKHLLNYLILPNFWLKIDKERQNIYDKIVNTIVVKKINSNSL